MADIPSLKKPPQKEPEEKALPEPPIFPTKRLVFFWPVAPVPLPLRNGFESRGYWVDVATTIESLLDLAKKQRIDLVLYQVAASDQGWEAGLTQLMQKSIWSRFVVLMESPTTTKTVRAMKLGAAGVFKWDEAPETILAELESPPFLSQTPSKIPLRSGAVLLGQGESFRHIHSLIERLHTVDSTVLITGESGTGKEFIAQAIHEHSPFKSGPFMAVNCGAIPENLLESELFGHVKGAFTDAKADHKGIFEACEGGTLLMDEVGDMPISLQVKLLRVLEGRQITPVGSTVSIPINVRVLASTNRDLEALVKDGTFRRDLFFRLAVVRMHVPPLRDRREDIPVLVNHYREHFCQRFSRPMPVIPSEVWSRLLSYDWPGNIRELRNVIERSVALATDGHLHLEEVLPEPKNEALSFPHFCPLNPANGEPAPFQEIKNCCEKSYLLRLLQLSNGNISEVARLSGRHRTEIYRQLEKLSLDPKKFQKP